MSSYVSAELRRLVVVRAEQLCEYCLIHENDTFLGCEVDHVVSEKHGGATGEDNLALACAACNRSKGSDIGSIARSSGAYCRFYHPRVDRWSDHFELNGAMIRPLTEIGEATTAILCFNSAERLLERELLIDLGRFPSSAAFRRIRG